ncbi:hypothetical protein M3Y97_00595500 [Aphelenchoides bicaudatus]|nr:hypothetical protein M3Y97_00595500 [Aphelenchoides bicaudatus]
MNKTTIDAVLCNCSSDGNKLGCQFQLRQILNRINAQLTNDYKSSPERLANADLYSIVILCLFAAIIIVIMIRAIKPSESLDDQVTIMLNSMRARCEDEEDIRHKMQLRKAKLKAKRWLNEAKMKTEFQIRKLSFRRSCRSLSTGPNSTKSQIVPSVSTLPLKPPCQRAASMQFLPEIVVTTSRIEDEQPTEEFDSSPQSSRSREPSSSRASSTQSLDIISQESYALDVFMDV